MEEGDWETGMSNIQHLPEYNSAHKSVFSFSVLWTLSRYCIKFLLKKCKGLLHCGHERWSLSVKTSQLPVRHFYHRPSATVLGVAELCKHRPRQPAAEGSLPSECQVYIKARAVVFSFTMLVAFQTCGSKVVCIEAIACKVWRSAQRS
jgi:hypothetical protein